MNFTTTRLATLALEWKDEAERRRLMSAHDVTADVLDYCAGELTAELTDVSAADEEVSPEAYALEQGRSVSTVRRWCASGALPARKVGREWVIRRGTPAPQLLGAPAL